LHNSARVSCNRILIRLTATAAGKVCTGTEQRNCNVMHYTSVERRLKAGIITHWQFYTFSSASVSSWESRDWLVVIEKQQQARQAEVASVSASTAATGFGFFFFAFLCAATIGLGSLSLCLPAQVNNSISIKQSSISCISLSLESRFWVPLGDVSQFKANITYLAGRQGRQCVLKCETYNF
jgi:hypothetical protein